MSSCILLAKLRARASILMTGFSFVGARRVLLLHGGGAVHWFQWACLHHHLNWVCFVGARRGLLLRGGGAVLERLANVTAVVLDKTGTLTEGELFSIWLMIPLMFHEVN